MKRNPKFKPENMVAYVLRPNELPRLKEVGGLGCAHAFHAGNQIARYMIGPKTQAKLMVKAYLGHPDAAWFNTAITLAAPKKKIEAIVRMAQKLGYPADKVVDPTYPVGDGFTVKAMTMGWLIGPRDDEEFRLLTAAFKLAD